jgi:hypothetical protein
MKVRHCSLTIDSPLSVDGSDRAECEQFAAQLGPSTFGILSDNDLAQAATFIGRTDLKTAARGEHGWGREKRAEEVIERASKSVE